MRVLFLDIETAPNTAHVWGLWQQDISLNQLLDSSYVMCWSGKWRGQKQIFFDSVMKSSPKSMIRRAHQCLEQADVVVHYNGKKFDIPTLNKEFVLHGLPPPAPYAQVDLLKVAQQQFRFPSNKLDYVAKALGLGQKVNHKGHGLWVECMAKDKAAWAKMEEYNKHDVALLEGVYDRLMPWIKSHPNHGLYDDTDERTCPNCGGHRLQNRGVYRTALYTYARMQCQKCGKWARSRRNDGASKSKDILVAI